MKCESHYMLTTRLGMLSRRHDYLEVMIPF